MLAAYLPANEESLCKPAETFFFHNLQTGSYVSNTVRFIFKWVIYIELWLLIAEHERPVWVWSACHSVHVSEYGYSEVWRGNMTVSVILTEDRLFKKAHFEERNATLANNF